jgi:ComF family protein
MADAKQPAPPDWLQESLDLVFPPVCLFCRCACAPTHVFPGICRSCLADLPLRFGARQYLAWPTIEGLPPALHGALIRCAAYYRQPLSQALVRLKFADAPDAAETLAGLAAPLLLKQPVPGHVLVAVPLHPTRLADRGYNQAALLVRHLSRQTGLPDLSAGLARVRATASQSNRQSRSERLVNLAGAFRLNRNLWQTWLNRPGQNIGLPQIILVDDILTTGATLTAAAQPFLAAGLSVSGLVIASNHQGRAIR